MDYQGELRQYFQRVRPVYAEIYGIAYVITADHAAATRAMQRAIYECWVRESRGGRRTGFREELRRSTREHALKEALSGEVEGQEMEWIDIRPGDEDEQAAVNAVLSERAEMARMLTLRFGCQISARSIARLMNASERQLTEQMDRFASRTRPRLSTHAKRHYETVMARVLRDQVIAQAAGMPDPMQVYRRLELEVSRENRSPHRRLSRVVNVVIVLLLALLCAALFWLVAVLMQPATTETLSRANIVLEWRL